MTSVLDSTIIIDHFNGIERATATIATAEDPAISVVTWIETVVGLRGPEQEHIGREFLRELELIPLLPAIAEATVLIRRSTRLKLPDAIILATARYLGCPLLTRNARDFGDGFPEVVVPYTLE